MATTVPNADDMSNDHFVKHMDLRHSKHVKNGPLANHPDRADEWVGPYRAFHERLHDLAVADEMDHEHLW